MFIEARPLGPVYRISMQGWEKVTMEKVGSQNRIRRTKHRQIGYGYQRRGEINKKRKENQAEQSRVEEKLNRTEQYRTEERERESEISLQSNIAMIS